MFVLGLITILTTAVLSSLSYSKVWGTVIRKCPRCFTYGEVSLIAQAIVLYLSSFGINLILLWSRYSIKQCHEIATFILQVRENTKLTEFFTFKIFQTAV